MRRDQHELRGVTIPRGNAAHSWNCARSSPPEVRHSITASSPPMSTSASGIRATVSAHRRELRATGSTSSRHWRKEARLRTSYHARGATGCRTQLLAGTLPHFSFERYAELLRFISPALDCLNELGDLSPPKLKRKVSSKCSRRPNSRNRSTSSWEHRESAREPTRFLRLASQAMPLRTSLLRSHWWASGWGAPKGYRQLLGRRRGSRAASRTWGRRAARRPAARHRVTVESREGFSDLGEDSTPPTCA